MKKYYMNYRILFLIPFLTSTLACNGSEWLYHKAMQYQENHDPSMVWLNTGEKIEVRYSNIKWKEVDTWKKGKQLFIAYRPETGGCARGP